MLIEAKIARVTLTGTFKLGLNWAFQNGLRIGTGNILSVNPAAAQHGDQPVRDLRRDASSRRAAASTTRGATS